MAPPSTTIPLPHESAPGPTDAAPPDPRTNGSTRHDPPADRAVSGRVPAGDAPLSREERRLRFWLRFWGLTFALEAIGYLTWVWNGPAASRGFAINSVAKDVVWFGLAFLAAANVRRFGRLVSLLIAGHVTISVLLSVVLLAGRTGSSFPPGPPAFVLDRLHASAPSSGVRLGIWAAAALVPAIMLAVLRIKAHRSQYSLRSLSPSQFETLAAIADASLTAPRIAPDEVAANVDRYWAAFRTRDRARLRAALVLVDLWPLATARPPLALMDRDSRRHFIRRHFVADIAQRRIVGALRRVVQAAFRFTTQMAYAGYYGDRRTYEVTGYQRFVDRHGAKEAIAALPPRREPLRTIPPREVDGEMVEAEIVIVGSGAGGGVVAHELVNRGHDVLIVERGRHVDSSAFSDDELSMYAQLYSDGALQLARDFEFQVLQGKCVGGSTVVNNGICIDLPQEVLDRWNGPGLEAGLPESLQRHFEAARRLIGARPVPDRVVSEGARLLVKGIERTRDDRPPSAFGPAEANFDGCLGCGNCNIGCAYGRKLSMLDGLLPEAQQAAERRRGEGDPRPGRLRVLSECEAVRIDREDDRATGLTCRIGGEQSRRVTVRAGQALVVAAGAIHSSRLLQDSGIARGRAGRGLCANIGSYMTGDFEREVRSYAGLQMTHVLEPPVEEGYAIETWFNPVMSQALLMPGWLDDHERNMARYAHMTCAGIVVGSQPNGSRVLPRWSPTRLLSGSDYDFTPKPEDYDRVIAALKQAGSALLRAGAKRVMPPTFQYREYTSEDQLDDLDTLRDDTEISLNTAHPQGGNAISADPGRGVVDPSCRVHGFENLYVCDASVFPTGVTVNPQLTVMALAHHAAHDERGLGAL